MGVKHQKKYSCMKGFNDLKKKLASLFGKWSRRDLEALPCEWRDPAKTPLLVVLVAAHGEGRGQVQGLRRKWAEGRPWGECSVGAIHLADDSVEVKWGDSASTKAKSRAKSRASDQTEGEVESTAVVLYAKVAVVRGA